MFSHDIKPIFLDGIFYHWLQKYAHEEGKQDMHLQIEGGDLNFRYEIKSLWRGPGREDECRSLP